MSFDLTNLNALVCGGSQGIGEAIALLFSECGANVTILSRNEDKLKMTLAKLKRIENQKHSYIVADLSDIQRLKIEIIPYIKKSYHFDIVVNNSGGPKPCLLFEAESDDLIMAFNQHIIASHLLMQNIIQQMKKNSFGRIINIISVGLKQPIENLGISNTIRGAMGSWAKTLSKELGQFGITVNNILPGHTLTPRLESLIQNRAKEVNLTIGEITSNMIADIPVKRLGQPFDIAYTAAFLATREAGFINGINIPVDGGWLKTL